jgi:hypothetical protein
MLSALAASFDAILTRRLDLNRSSLSRASAEGRICVQSPPKKGVNLIDQTGTITVFGILAFADALTE